MPVRKQEQTIRSGRFKSQQATLVIAKVETGTAVTYRIHNSGPNTFTVGATDGTPEPLTEGCSVDVPINVGNTTMAPATVTIGRVNNKEFVGVFDLIAGGSEVRSGRFQSDGAATLTIIQNGSGFYRVFNTTDGDVAITLAGGFAGSVGKNCSLDFAVSGTLTVSAGTAPFQGVYDRLGLGTEVRSGRFKHTVVGSGGNPAVLKLIDATGVAGVHRYRITNAGRKPAQDFSIKTSQNGTTWTEMISGVRLQPDQSFDFQIKTDVNRMIGVEGTIGKVISGVVDHLGTTP